MGRLTLLLADGSTLDIPLDRERTTIGRRADNDICLPYPAVSGEHAAIVTILDDSFLEDLNSTNGTLVNDDRVAKHFLRDGDRIDIGRQVLVYHADESAAAEKDDAAPRPGRTVRPRASRPAGEEPGEGAQADASQAESSAAPGLPPAPRHQGAADALGTLADALSRARRREVAPPPPEEAPVPEAAEVDTGTETPPADPAPAPSPARAMEPAPPPAVTRLAANRRVERPVLAEIRIQSGPRTGAVFPVIADETVVGRPGEGIVAIRHADGVFRLVAVEASTPVLLNGAPLAAGGSPIVPGDRFEVVGTRLAFALPEPALR